MKRVPACISVFVIELSTHLSCHESQNPTIMPSSKIEPSQFDLCLLGWMWLKSMIIRMRLFNDQQEIDAARPKTSLTLIAAPPGVSSSRNHVQPGPARILSRIGIWGSCTSGCKSSAATRMLSSWMFWAMTMLELVYHNFSIKTSNIIVKIAISEIQPDPTGGWKIIQNINNS